MWKVKQALNSSLISGFTIMPPETIANGRRPRLDVRRYISPIISAVAGLYARGGRENISSLFFAGLKNTYIINGLLPVPEATEDVSWA